MRAVLLALALCGCGVREEGLEVFVNLCVEQPLDASFTSATVAIEQVQLFPCVSVWRWLSPIGTAYAHGGDDTSDPRVLKAPVLIDLRVGELQPVATMHPPPGSYCGVAMTFAPSTVDARESGTTLYLESPSGRELSTRQLLISRSFDAVELDGDASKTLTLDYGLIMPPPSGIGDETLRALLDTLH